MSLDKSALGATSAAQLNPNIVHFALVVSTLACRRVAQIVALYRDRLPPSRILLVRRWCRLVLARRWVAQWLLSNVPLLAPCCMSPALTHRCAGLVCAEGPCTARALLVLRRYHWVFEPPALTWGDPGLPGPASWSQRAVREAWAQALQGLVPDLPRRPTTKPGCVWAGRQHAARRALLAAGGALHLAKRIHQAAAGAGRRVQGVPSSGHRCRVSYATKPRWCVGKRVQGSMLPAECADGCLATVQVCLRSLMQAMATPDGSVSYAYCGTPLATANGIRADLVPDGIHPTPEGAPYSAHPGLQPCKPAFSSLTACLPLGVLVRAQKLLRKSGPHSASPPQLACPYLVLGMCCVLSSSCRLSSCL